MGAFTIDVPAGRVRQARQVPSPNYDARPPETELSLIVVHGISLPPGEFGGPWIDDLFLNRLDPARHPYFAEVHEQRVSGHVLIRRDGELVQYVALTQRAWHAGPSEFRGQAACNDFSIGIELEGTDDSAYAAAQYEQLARLVIALQAAYPSIPASHVVGHCDIAPGRKTDPGPAFSWSRLWRLIGDRSRS